MGKTQFKRGIYPVKKKRGPKKSAPFIKKVLPRVKKEVKNPSPNWVSQTPKEVPKSSGGKVERTV